MTALVIRGGHLIDPAAGVDGLKDLLLKDAPGGRDCRSGEAEASQRG